MGSVVCIKYLLLGVVVVKGLWWECYVLVLIRKYYINTTGGGCYVGHGIKKRKICCWFVNTVSFFQLLEVIFFMMMLQVDMTNLCKKEMVFFFILWVKQRSYKKIHSRTLLGWEWWRQGGISTLRTFRRLFLHLCPRHVLGSFVSKHILGLAFSFNQHVPLESWIHIKII